CHLEHRNLRSVPIQTVILKGNRVGHDFRRNNGGWRFALWQRARGTEPTNTGVILPPSLGTARPRVITRVAICLVTLLAWTQNRGRYPHGNNIVATAITLTRVCTDASERR